MITEPYRDLTQVLLGGPVPGDLQRICDTLNDSRNTAQRDELRKLLHKWRDSGPNLAALWANDSVLEKEMKSVWVGRLEVDRHGQAHIVLTPTKWRASSAYEYAVGLFVALTLNRDFNRVAGPCTYHRCGRYFLQKGKRASIYCSRRCCQAQSATQHTQRRLTEERLDKLRRVGSAIKLWRKTAGKPDWRTFVCTREPDVTAKFLTRAVNSGDLQAPEKRNSGTPPAKLASRDNR